MKNLNGMSDTELLSDFRHIETQLRKVVTDAKLFGNPFYTQGALINEIIRLSQTAKTFDQTANLKRALTSFI